MDQLKYWLWKTCLSLELSNFPFEFSINFLQSFPKNDYWLAFVTAMLYELKF